jgi:multidrug efflux pump subunit AcrA (membrane-fusion protein)
MKRRRAIALVRWVLILAALAGAGVLASRPILQWLRPLVSVTHVVQGPVVQAFYATGTLLPEREYPIKSNNPGFITEVLVDKGDHVTKNQPLAIVDEDSVQFHFDQAKAERDLKQKMADEKISPALHELDARITAYTELLEIARREQKRVAGLLEKSASSAADLDRALDRVKTIWAEVEQAKYQRSTKKLDLDKDLEVAEAALKIARWNQDRQTIRSPIDNAVVLDRPATLSTRVAVNDHLMQIADVRPEKLIMRAAVDEEDKAYVKPGQTVRMTLYAFPGRNFQGKVKKIYDKADADRRTFEVDVEMADKSDAFAAGMTGELAFIVAEKDRAAVIPSQAVQSGRVWLVRDGLLQPADVRLGLKSIERVEVLSGLQNADLVVISAADGFQAGWRVRTKFVDPSEAAAVNKPKVSENPFKGFN